MPPQRRFTSRLDLGLYLNQNKCPTQYRVVTVQFFTCSSADIKTEDDDEEEKIRKSSTCTHALHCYDEARSIFIEKMAR